MRALNHMKSSRDPETFQALLMGSTEQFLKGTLSWKSECPGFLRDCGWKSVTSFLKHFNAVYTYFCRNTIWKVAGIFQRIMQNIDFHFTSNTVVRMDKKIV